MRKPTDNPKAVIDPVLLDRLVDNELAEDQRRALLLDLQRSEGGWRRCALAFLEAQAWDDALKTDVDAIFDDAESEDAPSATLPVERVAVPDSSTRREPRRRGLLSRLSRPAQMLSAMAASFLVAIAISSQWNSRYPNMSLPPDGVQPLVASNDPGATMAGTTSTTAMPTAMPRVLPQDEWKLVTLHGPVGPGGQESTIQLPAVQRAALDENWAQSLPSSLPADVRQSLQRTGHRVHEFRTFLPVQTNDGRQVVVPVDQVDVHYVGREAL